MAKYATTTVGYVNTRYYRAGGQPRRRRRSRMLTYIPVVLLLAGAWYGYNWYRDVLAGKQDCSPFCGILPWPTGTPEVATFDSASGWRVTYRKDWFGLPYQENREGIEWRGDHSQSVGLVTTSEADPRISCRATAAALPSGFDQIYSIPNAAIGDQMGVGAAFEKTIARPGKPPVRLRYFQICVTVGKVSLVGFAEGPRERDPAANHANPATTETAFLLGELLSAVEYVDDGGDPLSTAGES